MSALARGLLLTLAFFIGAATAAAAPTKEEIARAVKELGHNNFQTREKASVFLRAAGKPAEPALLEAAASKDAEVARRASEIIEEFKWGIYPDTPKNVLELIDKYRGGDRGVRVATIDALSNVGTPGYAALLKIAAAEDNPDLRDTIFQLMARETARAVPGILADGNYPLAEELLELSLASRGESAARNYAAFLLLRGRLDDKIAHYKVRAQAPKATEALVILTHLYRAKGALADARAAAEKAGNPALVAMILTDLGAWKDLATATAAHERGGPEDTEILSYLAAYHRLCGDTSAFDKDMPLLHKLSGPEMERNGHLRHLAKGLFLNDRPAAGLALLKDPQHAGTVFDVLCAQMRYREAFALMEAKGDDEPSLMGKLRRAQVLYQLGEKEQATKDLAALAERFKDGDLAPVFRELIRAEMRLGLRDQAFRHAATALSKIKDEERAADLLNLVFPRHAAAAEMWWKVLAGKGEAPEAALNQISLLLEGKVKGEDLDALEQAALKAGAQEAKKPGRYGPWLLAFVEACLAAGDARLAEDWLKTMSEQPKDVGEATAATALLRWGDLLAQKKDWPAAAERYQKAWLKDRTQALPLYLHGKALLAAGQEAEARKVLDLAHLIPLANEEARFALAAGLSERGYTDDAQRQRDLLLRVGPDEGWHMNETLRHTAYDAMNRKDYLCAADLFERFRLRCLRSNTSFVEHSAFVYVPLMVHQNRARGLIAAGKLDEAKQAVKLAQEFLPGSVNLPILLANALDRAGRTKEADELVAETFAFQEKLCADYPNNATAHNSLAWLTAACRRKLDQGEEHARRAVELAPKQANHLDTLAEIIFQRGDKEAALKTLKRCLDLEPKNEYYKRQMKRLEAGDPKAPLPEA